MEADLIRISKVSLWSKHLVNMSALHGYGYLEALFALARPYDTSNIDVAAGRGHPPRQLGKTSRDRAGIVAMLRKLSC